MDDHECFLNKVIINKLRWTERKRIYINRHLPKIHECIQTICNQKVEIMMKDDIFSKLIDHLMFVFYIKDNFNQWCCISIHIFLADTMAFRYIIILLLCLC